MLVSAPDRRHQATHKNPSLGEPTEANSAIKVCFHPASQIFNLVRIEVDGLPATGSLASEADCLPDRSRSRRTTGAGEDMFPPSPYLRSEAVNQSLRRD